MALAPVSAGEATTRDGGVPYREHAFPVQGPHWVRGAIGELGEPRSYFYSHLRQSALVRGGERVWAGQRVGGVGKTGNARSVGCHLHFEIRERGRPIDPEPILRRWDRLG